VVTGRVFTHQLALEPRQGFERKGTLQPIVHFPKANLSGPAGPP
jgi:hypothetical protein